MIAIYPYQTQAVRDLAWACFAPPLLHLEQLPGVVSGVAPCALQLTPARTLWLEELDRDATALLQHLALRPTHRLGVYFEQLWHFFLQQDADTELIAHNLPVHVEGRTLGEFDCIYYCHQSRHHVHLELAVKYFLGLRQTRSGNDEASAREWVGPDNRDRLDIKLDQLLRRQIRLGDQPEAKRQLAALGIENLVKEIALKGYLFQPVSNAPPPPPGHNVDCMLNQWVSCDSIQSWHTRQEAEAYLILPKMQWLSPAHCDDLAMARSLAQLQVRLVDRFERDRYPVLVVALDAYGWESRRFFVTPNNWPESNPQATGNDILI